MSERETVAVWNDANFLGETESKAEVDTSEGHPLIVIVCACGMDLHSELSLMLDPFDEQDFTCPGCGRRFTTSVDFSYNVTEYEPAVTP